MCNRSNDVGRMAMQMTPGGDTEEASLATETQMRPICVVNLVWQMFNLK
jgi:hypothetical protein